MSAFFEVQQAILEFWECLTDFDWETTFTPSTDMPVKSERNEIEIYYWSA